VGTLLLGSVGQAAADRHDADLVVLGSRRPSPLGELVLGSVAHEAIHGLHRAVLLARRPRPADSEETHS